MMKMPLDNYMVFDIKGAVHEVIFSAASNAMALQDKLWTKLRV